VFQVQEIRWTEDKSVQFLGQSLAGKETRFVEDEHMKEEFHTSFCTTQKEAFRFAKKFNERLELFSQLKCGIGGLLRIRFLDCNVYGLSTGTKHIKGDEFERYMLVEELLEKKKYMKWNNNCGFVEGVIEKTQALTLLEIEDPWENRIRKVTFSANLEEIIPNSTGDHNSQTHVKEQKHEADSNLEDEDFSIYRPRPSFRRNSPTVLLQSSVSDYLQAFSHWTYIYSKREKLVCDFQGVFDEVNNVVCLTDPVIHCEGNRGEKVYGRTNHGRSGMNNFFESHTRTPVCKFLGLDPRTIN
jgi:hypothetical protein